jgi:hypothetical protein
LVWDKLTAGLTGLVVPDPSPKALRDLRRRVGVRPVRAVFEVLAGPLAQPRTPGARFAGYRTVSFDGCTSLHAPDTQRNRAWLTKRASDSYPTLELMTLAETGTRAVFRPSAEGEVSYAARLLHLLRPDMLVLWDLGFDSNAFLLAVHATRARVLGRMTASRRPPVVARLSDGSYLSHLGGLPVRIIEASITVSCQDGTVYSGVYRLVTTLTDHHRYPATALITLYHERWEHESAYFALRHTILRGRVLRSGDRVGLEQELWATLTVYQILRIAMVWAAESVPGIDPDRASFTLAYQAARDRLVKAEAIVTDRADLVGEIGRKVLGGLLPARRLRVSTRKVKAPHSRYHIRKPAGRPLTSQHVTALDIVVREPSIIEYTEAQPAPQPGVPGTVRTRRECILELMRSDPTRAWHGRDIAQWLGATNPNVICVQLSRRAQTSQFRKVGPATYALPSPAPNPLAETPEPLTTRPWPAATWSRTEWTSPGRAGVWTAPRPSSSYARCVPTATSTPTGSSTNNKNTSAITRQNTANSPTTTPDQPTPSQDPHPQ